MTNSKTETNSKKLGLAGEDKFKSHLWSLNLEFESHELFQLTGQEKKKFNAYLHPIKIHYEDDYGLDFDTELFFEHDEEKYEPSGVHFFFQLKSTAKKPTNIRINDLNYLIQQERWGRKVFIVWQHLDSGLEIDEIKILNFSKWVNNHGSEINEVQQKEVEQKGKKSLSVNIKGEEWEVLDRKYLQSNIMDYMISVSAPHFFRYWCEELNKLVYSICKRLKEYNPSIIIKEKGYSFNNLYYPLNQIVINDKKFAIIGCYFEKEGDVLDLSKSSVKWKFKVDIPNPSNLSEIIKDRNYDGVVVVITNAESLQKIPANIKSEIIKAENGRLSFSLNTDVFVILDIDLKNDPKYLEVYDFLCRSTPVDFVN